MKLLTDYQIHLNLRAHRRMQLFKQLIALALVETVVFFTIAFLL